MRYELSDGEWATIRPMLPNKPRGVPRVDDRRVLNGIFWVLRSGAPWRDLPIAFGPYTTCYNRFVRWRRAGVWSRIIDALAAAHDAAVQMIDTSIVRVHQHGACVSRNKRQSMGRSRGGLTSKIHAVVDGNGLPIRLALTGGEAHDNRLAAKLLSRLQSGAMLLADRGYDADWIRALVNEHGAWANIPPRRNRNDALCFSPYLYRARNLVERFFNKIKQCRRVATRYDKLAANYLAFIQLASIRLWLRVNESTPLNLFKDGIPRAELQAVSGLYRRYRATAFQMRYVWISAALGVIAFVLFVYLHFSRDYAYWWGHEQHGVAGLVFAVSVGVMVSAGVWGLIIVVFGSWMLARLVTLPIALRPFHQDCCNGLAPLGRQILLLWGSALFGGVAIYIALRLGYLGIERTPLVWLLAGLGSLAIPAIAIVPLYSVVMAVKRVQSASLERLGQFLNHHLDDADTAIRNGDLATAQSIISQIDKVKGLFEIYRTANVWPFNPKAFTLILVANIVQIVLTAKQLLSLAPT